MNKTLYMYVTRWHTHPYINNTSIYDFRLAGQYTNNEQKFNLCGGKKGELRLIIRGY